jgi:HEPN domain-containing protein
MAKKEIEFLKEKAKKFYSNAKDLFKKGDYDLCAFNLEQSCQLYIKYLIAKKSWGLSKNSLLGSSH